MFNFNKTDVGLVVLNSTYKIIKINKKIKDFFNVNARKVRKQGLQIIFDEETYKKIVSAIASSEVTSVQFAKNNKLFEVHIGYLLARREQYVILIITDVSQFKIEKEIKDTIPKILDHIIKTNTIMLIYADIIKKNTTNSYIRHAAAMFKKNIIALNKMIKKLKKYIEK